MNKTLTIILVIIVIIGGFFLFFRKSNTPIINDSINNQAFSNPEATNPKINGVPIDANAQMETGTVEESNVVITYTNNGFSPKNITVKKGNSVTFVNENSGPMSVASDSHPTHTIYPEFDQYKSAEKGKKSYTFVFDKIGSWNYHNHMKSSDTGTVNVE